MLAAMFSARAVLPAPPGPIRVISFDVGSSSRSRTSAISRSRPMRRLSICHALNARARPIRLVVSRSGGLTNGDLCPTCPAIRLRQTECLRLHRTAGVGCTRQNREHLPVYEVETSSPGHPLVLGRAGVAQLRRTPAVAIIDAEFDLLDAAPACVRDARHHVRAGG